MLQNMNKKIKSQPIIVKIVRNLKKQGKIIVTFSGSFDILHIGHVKSLEEAKKQGDVLIVLLNSDVSVRGYKGPKRPIISQENRAEMLAALKCVDYIVLFNELNVKKIISKIKPNIHCNGAEWGENCVESEIIKKQGGKIYILKSPRYESTSNLINKILKAYSKPMVKATFIDVNEINKKQSVQDFKKLTKNGYKVFIFNNKQHLHFDKIITQAVKKFGISLNDSWIIGDKENDIILGKEINAETVKIGNKLSKEKIQPNYYADNFKKAVNIIINKA